MIGETGDASRRRVGWSSIVRSEGSRVESTPDDGGRGVAFRVAAPPRIDAENRYGSGVRIDATPMAQRLLNTLGLKVPTI
jgi:carbohydrate-selective porin OprB